MVKGFVAALIVFLLGIAVLRAGFAWTAHQVTYPPSTMVPTGPTVSISPITVPPTYSIPTYGH